jgi:trans-2,3-dihydro-3-hydroxyanthranilate isomerase
MSDRKFEYVQVDVFSDRRLQGNMLCVFPDARGLADDEMQAIARETNLSETTFIFPRDAREEAERGVRVRIFTTAEELPFAGHPTLGTAWVLRQRTGRDLIELDLNIGKIPVRFQERDGSLFGEMRQRDPEFGPMLKVEDLAACTNLAPDDFDRGLPIQTVSTGVPFAVVPLKSVEALSRLRLDLERCGAYLKDADTKFPYFLTPDGGGGAAAPRMRARMIFYNGEDPATGSAAGCAAAWMVRHGLAKPDQQVVIEQGVEMKRRSLISVRAGRDGDRIVQVHVGGNVVQVMRGELTL